MSSLFGVELPTPVNFIIAFVVVLGLIGAVAWLVRRFGTTRLDAATRSRQPRLAVIDSAAIDGRRRLVIIRRDNVEHLLMIGGPSDVVVETNIVRAATATAREAPAPRNGGVETLPRAIPLPDPNAWPLQPEPIPAAAPRIERGPRVVAEDAAHWHGEPAPAPARAARAADTLSGLAAELARPPETPAPVPRATLAESAPAASASHPGTAIGPQPPPDQSLAEMAQRLEAALRRPSTQSKAAVPPKPAAEAGGPRLAVAAEAKTPPRTTEPKVAAQAGKTTAPPRSAGSLEQEMASLLGRPGKT